MDPALGHTERTPKDQPPSTGLRFGPYELFPAQRWLAKDGEAVRIGSRALELLIILSENAGVVVSNDELVRRVWGKSVVGENNLRVHIASLRKALGDGAGGARYIDNIPLRGYCFVSTVNPIAPTMERAGPPVESPGFRLPRLAAPLFGREETVRSLVDNVSAHRLVTIVGTGGIGKTSVAIAVAQQQRPNLRDGVLFVDFAMSCDGESAAQVPLRALGMDHLVNNPTDVLKATLRGKHMLLVFDNCDHVIDAVAQLAEDLTQQEPGISVLATSREPLFADGEVVQRLPPLALPPDTDDLYIEDALSHSAVQLFVERTTASMNGFELDTANVRAVTHLCRRLDGLPLAIELAAACVHAFGVNELASRLDHRLSLSMKGRRTALPRHQTLQAAIDWSYLALSGAEQAGLRRLHIFKGTFTRDEALAAIEADADNDGVGHEILTQLVQKSLVHVDVVDSAIHYRLFETTRAFAMQKCLEAGIAKG